MAKFGTYEWLMQKRNPVSVILPSPPTPPPTPPPCSSDLIGFNITTTSGNILIIWGDDTQQTVLSDTSVSHDFFCPHTSASIGFWTNIDPCIQC
jgi:hypothetical protein